MKKLAIVYNPAAGGKKGSKSDIKEAFAGQTVQLNFIEIDDDIAENLRKAQQAGCEAYIAAGGDGTVNAVAHAAVAHNMPLGVLPVGTLNHFAKDIGMPLKLAEAAAVIAAGRTNALDYATVNEKVFVNNSSIGVYPDTVLRRDQIASKIGKWPAATFAALEALFSISTTHLSFVIGSKKRTYKTPMMFIGNNSYEIEQKGFTNRTSLDSGKLFLYVVRANRPTALIRLALLAFLGRRIQGKDCMQDVQQSVRVESRKSILDVALDGEVDRKSVV